MKNPLSRQLLAALILLGSFAAAASYDGVSDPSKNIATEDLFVPDEVLFAGPDKNIGFYAANGALIRQDAMDEAQDRARAICQMLTGKYHPFTFFKIARSQRAGSSDGVVYQFPTLNGPEKHGRLVIQQFLGLKRVEHFEFKSLHCSKAPTPTPTPQLQVPEAAQ